MSSGLPSTIAAAATNADPSLEQMKELGTEFESVFLSMLLKEMRNSLEDGFFGGEGSDSFGGMFDLFIGQHLAKSNAIGVSDLLMQQYSKGAGGDQEKPPEISISA
jgi:flagellar protein FlgJ